MLLSLWRMCPHQLVVISVASETQRAHCIGRFVRKEQHSLGVGKKTSSGTQKKSY